MMNKLPMIALCALPLLAGCAVTPHQGASYAREVSPAGFTADAVADREAEQTMAKIALARTESDDVRAYANKVLADAQSNDPALKTLASANNVAFPAELKPQDQGDIDTLRSVARGEFDKYYTDIASRDERKALTTYTLAAQSGNPEIAGYAQATAPVLQQHFEAANALHAEVNPDYFSRSNG